MAVESTARSWFLNLNMFSNGIQSDSFVCVSVGGGNLEHKKLGAQVWYSHKQQTCTYMHGPRRDIDSEFNLDRRGCPLTTSSKVRRTSLIMLQSWTMTTRRRLPCCSFKIFHIDLSYSVIVFFSSALVLTYQYMMLVLRNEIKTPEKNLDLRRSNAVLFEVPPDNQLGDETLYPPSPVASVTWMHQQVKNSNNLACQV